MNTKFQLLNDDLSVGLALCFDQPPEVILGSTPQLGKTVTIRLPEQNAEHTYEIVSFNEEEDEEAEDILVCVILLKYKPRLN